MYSDSLEKVVVIGDEHGHVGHLQRIVDQYEHDEDVTFCLIGDVIDSPNRYGVRSSLELIKELGSRCILLLGNHEWSLLLSLNQIEGNIDADADSININTWHREWLRRYENNTANCYGVPVVQTMDHLRLLRHNMYGAGHLQLIEQAPPYLETNDLIIVHAGVSKAIRAREQLQSLQDAADTLREGQSTPIPPQIIDHRYSTSRTGHPDLTKTLITGHSHFRAPASARIFDDGRRVRLASKVSFGDPLYYYESWSGRVRSVEQSD